MTAATAVTRDVTYYAQWTKNTDPTPLPPDPVMRTVTFDANGGNVSETSRTVTDGAAVGEFPTAVHDGFRLVGWVDADGNAVTAATVVISNVTYYAQWEMAKYGPFVAGMQVDIDSGLVGYKANGLPAGLKYAAKTGKVTGMPKTAGEYKVTFTKTGEDDVTVIFTVRAEEVSVGCDELSLGAFISGVAGNTNGIPLKIETETGVKSVTVSKLPAGMKYDAKKNLITGAPMKAGDYTVTVTVATKSGAKQVVAIPVTVAAAANGAVGTFNGFAKADGSEENIGTFTLTTTDAGKITAKVITAAGAYSFGGTCWDYAKDDVYTVALATKQGETLTLSLDSAAGWDANQLIGAFAAVSSKPPCQVVARKNAFGKTWYFSAAGDEENGWTLAYAPDAKAAALTVTLNADGSTKIAGKLGALSANASGYVDVTELSSGVIVADFAPVVSAKDGKTTFKRVLSIRTHLWFDRSNDHVDGIGTVRVVE